MIRTTATLLFAFAMCAAHASGQAASPQSAAEAEVLKVDDSLRVAKMHHDIETLRQIAADDLVALNQHGTLRNKAEFLELWRTWPLAVSHSKASVRLSGDVAIVIGSETQVIPKDVKLLYTHVYVRRNGRWQLLCSTMLTPPSP